MKKYMPLEGLRWSRDSGSALCDTSQNSRSRTGWGGKYKGILQQLMMERDYAFQRQIRYYVNVDIDKIMRKLS